MKNLEEGPSPDEALLEVVKKVVRYAEKGAKERHLRPNHFIVHISSEVLDSDLFVHMRSTSEGEFTEFLREFERVDTSNRMKGRPSILEKPFIIDCTAIDAGKRIKGKKRKHPGAGTRQQQRRRQKQLKIKYNVHEGAFWVNF